MRQMFSNKMKAVFWTLCALLIYMIIGVFMVIVIKTSEHEDEYDETDFRLAVLWPLVLVVVLYFVLEREISFLIQKIVSWLLYKNHKQEKNEKD